MSGRGPFKVLITRRAEKDIRKLHPRTRGKLAEILRNRIAMDPLSGKKLLGELSGCWSVRLNIRDRIVYRVDLATRTVYILRARTHYEP